MIPRLEKPCMAKLSGWRAASKLIDNGVRRAYPPGHRRRDLAAVFVSRTGAL
jgi:hypothetical protein